MAIRTLRAKVTGNELYSTEVRIEDDVIAGACDCPNAEDGRFIGLLLFVLALVSPLFLPLVLATDLPREMSA